MTAVNALWCAGALVAVALVLAGPIRWLNRWADRRGSEAAATRAALIAARRVRINLVKTPDEDAP